MKIVCPNIPVYSKTMAFLPSLSEATGQKKKKKKQFTQFSLPSQTLRQSEHGDFSFTEIRSRVIIHGSLITVIKLYKIVC